MYLGSVRVQLGSVCGLRVLGFVGLRAYRVFEGLGYRGSGFRVCGLRVQGFLGFRAQGFSGFRVEGCRVQGFRA